MIYIRLYGLFNVLKTLKSAFILWFDHFLNSRAEIGILVQTMTPKGHFEIKWPLTDLQKIWRGEGEPLLQDPTAQPS